MQKWELKTVQVQAKSDVNATLLIEAAEYVEDNLPTMLGRIV